MSHHPALCIGDCVAIASDDVMPPSPAMCLGRWYQQSHRQGHRRRRGSPSTDFFKGFATVSTEPFDRALRESLSKECFTSVLRGSALTERFEGVRRERYLREIRHLLQKGLRQDVVI